MFTFRIWWSRIITIIVPGIIITIARAIIITDGRTANLPRSGPRGISLAAVSDRRKVGGACLRFTHHINHHQIRLQRRQPGKKLKKLLDSL